MMKFIKNKLKEEKGLTLIELLAVIVILGIIAAIAIPAIGNIITNSRVNALKADGQNVLAAANMYFADEGATEKSGTGDSSVESVKVSTLKNEGYLDNLGGFQPADTDKVTKKKGGNELTGVAEKSGTKVEFKSATNDDIKDAGKEGTAKVVITR